MNAALRPSARASSKTAGHQFLMTFPFQGHTLCEDPRVSQKTFGEG
jgi:hypothetical protein